MKRIISLLIIFTIILIILPQALADLDDGIVAYWPFSGNANDASGNGHHGTAFGAKLCGDRFGNQDSAFCFGGVDDYVNISDSPELSGGVGKSFTWSVWFNAASLPIPRNQGPKILSKIKDLCYKDWVLSLRGQYPDQLLWAYENGCSNQGPLFTSSQTVNTDKWYHYAIAYNGKNRNVKMYIDGKLENSTTTNYHLPDTDGPVKIGRGEYELNGSWGSFHGKIDDIRIYNRVLPKEEIQQLFSGKCGFLDVPPGYWAEDAICTIYDEGITTGCSKNPLKYCPKKDVTREQMAAFIVRADDGEPPADYCDTGSPFSDVPQASIFCKYIKRLSELGITQGCGGGNYCPKTTVKRDQMAAFLVRAVEGEPPDDYCDTGSPFPDVDPASGFCKYIKRLSELEITKGCGGGKYCPKTTVKRDQMAVFLGRAFLGME